MTNEELEKMAHVVFEKHVRLLTVNNLGADDVHECVEGIARFARSLVSQAYEEAAQAVCLYCLREYLLQEYAGGGWYHLDAEGNEWPCAGSKARVLRDRLQPVEPPRRPLSEHPRITDRHSIR